MSPREAAFDLLAEDLRNERQVKAELLAALKALCKGLGAWRNAPPDAVEAFRAACDAIAKAEGQ